MIPKQKSANESVDDPLLCFRSESDATVVEPADDRDYVSSDTVEQKRPIALDSLRDELTRIQLALKNSVAAPLERTATVEQRLSAIESRLRELGDRADVRREGKTQAFMESAWRRVRELVDQLKSGGLKVRRSWLAVATVFTALALMSAFALHSVGRTALVVARPFVTTTAPIPSTALPVLPSATSETPSSKSSLDSATTLQRSASARRVAVASAEFETPATPRATEFVGTLSIRSTPDGAKVSIDRERVGETPLVLRRVRAGSHAIWIEHEGYRRWTAGVTVPADERTQVTVTLQAEPGQP